MNLKMRLGLFVLAAAVAASAYAADLGDDRERPPLLPAEAGF